MLLVTPRLPKHLPQFLDEHAIDQVLHLPDCTTDKRRRISAILELLYGTGIRVELVALSIGDYTQNIPLATAFPPPVRITLIFTCPEMFQTT